MFKRLFLSHPASVNETYLQHQLASLSFAMTLLCAAMAAAIHAVIPALCRRTVSDTVRRMHAELEQRNAP